MKVVRIVCLLTLIAAFARPAAADRIVLTDGRVVTGKIVSESDREVEIKLADGMKLVLEKTLVRSIEREIPKENPPGGKGMVDFFMKKPDSAWRSTFGRYPELFAVRKVPFRAYEFVDKAPLHLPADSPGLRELIARHGHGGSLSLFKFRYVGMRELNYGDKVKFIGEITSPVGARPAIIDLEQGPVETATRIVVILVWGKNGIRRYATTTVFTGRDFRQKLLNELTHVRLPVRTYDVDYTLQGTAWLTPSGTAFLEKLTSPFGELPRIRIARYRFRLAWFRTDLDRRPALDPVLLERNSVRPLAAKGRPAATPALVRKVWGTEATAAKQLAAEIAKLQENLARVGVKPGADFYIERDRVGTFGRKGVTIETVRIVLSKDLLHELLRP